MCDTKLEQFAAKWAADRLAALDATRQTLDRDEALFLTDHDAQAELRALAEDAARFNARLENVIREAPEEWLWMYSRWRRLDRMRAREAAKV